MKILTVSDEECAALWDNYVPGRLKEYDLILSCGDHVERFLLTEKSAEVAWDFPYVLANTQVGGIYRVRYSPEILAALPLDTMANPDLILLFSDVFQLCRMGFLPAVEYLKLVRRLHG